MATTSTPHPHRPFIDPDRFEAAGRRLRHWLDGFARTQHPAVPEDDIAWEDGEPHEQRRMETLDR